MLMLDGKFLTISLDGKDLKLRSDLELSTIHNGHLKLSNLMEIEISKLLKPSFSMANIN
jgi:hypothetical protein